MLTAGKPWKDLATELGKAPTAGLNLQDRRSAEHMGDAICSIRTARWGPLNWLGKDFGARSTGGTLGERVYHSSF